MQEELFTDRFVSVDIADVLDFNFASDVAIRRRRNGQNPQFTSWSNLQMNNNVIFLVFSYETLHRFSNRVEVC